MQDDLIRRYLQFLEHNLGRQSATVTSYESYLKRLMLFLEQRKKILTDASRYDLEEFTGIQAHNDGMRASSRRPLIAAVRGFYGWLHERQYISSNPAKLISYPKSGKPLPTPITTQNLEKLLQSIQLDSFINIRDAAMIALLAGTGMRISGLLSLNSSSLVGYQRFRDIARVTIRVTEKGAKERIIPVPDVAVLYLHCYLGHPYLKEVDRRLSNGDEVLFVNTVNTHVKKHERYGEALRLQRAAVWNMIKTRGEAIGITPDQLRPHAFRHWYGTDLLNRGRNIKEIQMLMGHENIKTTEQYLHLAMEQLIEATDASSLNILNTPMREIADKMKRKPLATH